MCRGLIHIYCGDGKGKSTAAMGLCVRAAGAGKRVVLAQFLKDGSSAERKPLQELGVCVIPCPAVKKFVFQMTPPEKCSLQEQTLAMWADATSRNCDLLVLDELCGALSTGIMSEDTVLDFLKHKPEALEVAITGRDPSPALLAVADYISEIKKIKHPYDQGIQARRGIEF